MSYTDPRSGVTTPVSEWRENCQEATWGNQVDGQGNIWHAYTIPTEVDGLSNGKLVRFVIIDGQKVPTPPNCFVTRLRSMVIESAGKQIVDAFQQEALNELYLLPSGELENDGSMRDFTYAGQPIRQGMLVSRFTKVGPFEPVEVLDGVDLLDSLNDYLRNHNMSQLVREKGAR